MIEWLRSCWEARHERMVAALAILIFVMGLLSVVTFRAVNTAKEAQRQLVISQKVGCDRANVIRGYFIVDAGRNARKPQQRQQAALDLFPIQDCSKAGKVAPLPVESRAAQDAYLSALAKRMGVTQDWKVSER